MASNNRQHHEIRPSLEYVLHEALISRVLVGVHYGGKSSMYHATLFAFATTTTHGTCQVAGGLNALGNEKGRVRVASVAVYFGRALSPRDNRGS